MKQTVKNAEYMPIVYLILGDEGRITLRLQNVFKFHIAEVVLAEIDKGTLS